MYNGHSSFSLQNNTTDTLGAGETFTGGWEQNYHDNVAVSCYSDTAGTLYFDFSPDGVNSNQFPPNGFNVSAGIHEFHTAVKLPRYFRVRFVNSASVQSEFRLYTYFGDFRQPNAPVGLTISDDADAIVTKSVISGVGDTTAKVTAHAALQVTPTPDGKSAFGEALVSQLAPIIQQTFIYNLNPSIYDIQNNQSGSAAIVSSVGQCSTGAAANSSSTIYSQQRIYYRAGQGVRARFTGMFTTGVADSTQLVGIGDIGEGFFFGYNGTSFGILRRNGGNPEVRTLTVTTGSSDAENITITLDGDAKNDVAVTNTADVTLTANEIAAADYSDVGRGWTARAVGDTVLFISWDAAAHSGSYSLSGATSAIGTFAQTLAASAQTDTWVAQASWNGDDIFDGNGVTSVTLDPTKLNVFQIDFQYLGAGAIRFYIEDPTDGELHLVHTIQYANANTVTSLDNPSLRFMMSAENAANTSDLTVSSASYGLFIDGLQTNIGLKRGLTGSLALGATATPTPIISFRLKEVYQGIFNRAEMKINLISAAVEHTKPCVVNFYADANLTGASFGDLDTNTSSMEYDTSATARTGGVLFFSIPLGKAEAATLDLKDDFSVANFGPGAVITAELEPTSGNGAESVVSFNFTERL